MKIALDAMGGDLAPRSPVVGTLQFLQDQTSGMEVILVGDQTILKEELGGSIPKGIRIHLTTDHPHNKIIISNSQLTSYSIIN